MGLFSRRPVLTAAAGDPTTGRAITADASNTGAYTSGGGASGWQAQSLGYLDRVPEHSNSNAFIGWCFSRINLRPGLIGDDLEVTPLFDDDGVPRDGTPADLASLANELVVTLRSPYGGQPQLLGAMGELLASTGEGYLVGTDKLDAVGNVQSRQWEFLSILEIRPKRDAKEGEVPYVRHRSPGEQPELLPDSSVVIRMHIPAAAYSGQPRSAAKPLLSTLEVLDLLTQEEASQTRSRLTGPGVYWVPSEIDLPPDPDHPEIEPFTAQMIKAMGTAVQDKGSAAGYVPIIFRGAYQYLDRIQQHAFRPDDAKTIERRAAKVTDYARGVDLPMEVTTGLGGSTHWSAWAVDENVIKIHIEPKLLVICWILTTAYLHPLLMQAQGLDPEANPVPPDIARLAITYDAANLIVHPNREQSAQWGVGTERMPNFVISLAASRRHQGWSEDDAPDEAEIEERVRRAQLLNARETLQGLVPVGQDAGTGNPGGDPSIQTPGQDEQAPSTAPNGVQASANGHTNGNGHPDLGTRILIAVEMAAERAVDRTGARLRDRANRNPNLAPLVAGLEASAIPLTLGRETVDRLAGAEGLFPNEFRALARTVRNYAVDAHHANPDLVARRTVLLAEQVAGRRLYSERAEVKREWVDKVVAG